ncbi:unnamed protein product [Polarella glacialis]|uniref:Uncharacterized protein n=1 Tax=Polarella glacialis TaxID=89957 RepID=A0A813FLU7_POLGL|nr:unnamed protein product [Polarella glacialis]
MGDSRRLSYREVSHVGVLDRSAGEFCWNCRPCKGTELHIAALEGDREAAKRLVSLASEEEQRVAVTSRFTYETIFNDKEQEGSGEAIHLAVSRGHVQVAKYLLSLGAELENTVSRDHRPHYNVLHAAMFAEGRGGSLEIIKYLLEAKASPMIKNLDGRYPLHIAFMTGNVQVITFLREFLLKEGIEQHHYQDSKVPLPLSLGICEGKMSEEQLSDAAELSTLSLTTFISECPQCIPSFLKRFSKVEHISAKDLARSLTRFDIARVLRESPEAAMALLDHATDLPECSNPGWHSLPTRVSFAPRNFAHKFQELFNPPTEYFTFYEEQHTWEYDSLRFQAPKWHSVLTDRSFGRPIVDAEVQACAEVFAAICDSGSADGLGIFDNDVVHAAITLAITHVFWSGCSRADLTIVLLSAWGLALLILEEMFLRSYSNSEEVFAERSLLAHGGHGGHASGDVSDIMSGLQENPRSQQDRGGLSIGVDLCSIDMPRSSIADGLEAEALRKEVSTKGEGKGKLKAACPNVHLDTRVAEVQVSVDSDPDPQQLQVKVAITPAKAESSIDAYALFWGKQSCDSGVENAKNGHIRDFKVGESMEAELPVDTLVPDGSTHLLVFARKDGLGESDFCVSVPIEDNREAAKKEL